MRPCGFAQPLDWRASTARPYNLSIKQYVTTQEEPFSLLFFILHAVHTLFTKCIFGDSYPQRIRVIHVEIVENPVESVENFPPFHVPMVENLWKTMGKPEIPLRKTFRPTTFRQENCCTSPWKMLQ